MDIQLYPIQMFRVIPDFSCVELNWIGYRYDPNCSGKVWILTHIKKNNNKKKIPNLSHRHSRVTISLPLLSPHQLSLSLSLEALQSPPLLIVTLSLSFSVLRLILVPPSLRINWVFLPLSFLR